MARQPTLTFTAKIRDNGTIKLGESRSGMQAQLKEYYAGSSVMLMIKPKRKPGSDRQLKYWWGVVVSSVLSGLNDQCQAGLNPRIAKDTEMVHRMLMRTCWADPEYVVSPEGEVLFVKEPSYSSLSSAEREELHHRTREWAYNILGLTILLPNEQGLIDYKEPVQIRS